MVTNAHKTIDPAPLLADLKRLKLTRRSLASKLSKLGHGPGQISEQAVGHWIIRDGIPTDRVGELVEILGQDSDFAQAQRAGELRDYQSSKKLTVNLAAPKAVVPSASPMALMLGEWLDKLPDDLVKLEVFQACTDRIVQALRKTQPSPAPAPAHAAEKTSVKHPA
jgi:hypothetical protein